MKVSYDLECTLVILSETCMVCDCCRVDVINMKYIESGAGSMVNNMVSYVLISDIPCVFSVY